MTAKIIGIVSFKGGVGKTVSAINIAAALMNGGSRVLVLDFNFLSPTLHVYLGLFGPEITLKDAIVDKKMDFTKTIYEHQTGLHIVPSLFCKKVDLETLRERIDEVRKDYDFIILDSGTNYHEEVLPVFEVSDEVILVTTPDYPTLYTSLKIVDVALDFNKNIKGVLVNRKLKKSFELTRKDIEDTLGLRVIGEVLDDSEILKSFSRFMSIVDFNLRNKNSKEYLRIASFIKEGEDIREYGEVI